MVEQKGILATRDEGKPEPGEARPQGEHGPVRTSPSPAGWASPLPGTGLAPFVPIRLTDLRRLPEIYRLRVTAWESSDKREHVNGQLFPEGWSDEFEATAQHFVVPDEEGRIVAAGRLHVFQEHERLPHWEALAALDLPRAMPAALLSRLVVHPEHRGRGLSRLLDEQRLQIAARVGCRWALGLTNGKRAVQLCAQHRFRSIGEIQLSYHEATRPHWVQVLVRKLEG